MGFNFLEKTTQMALAIFDLDNTLLGGDSDHLWGQFLVEKGIVDEAVYKKANNQFYADYLAGSLDILEYLAFSLKPLKDNSLDTLNAWHAEFMQSHIEPIYLPKAQQLVDKHRANGDTLLIITATNSFVTQPIATRYGIEHLIGADPEMVDGQYTGKVSGVPSFQEGKVTRLNDWLTTNQHDLADSYFYSDSRNDIPLLEIVDHPIVVDADDYLLNHAKEKGWQSISLRD